jgi:hypothetical protein
MHIFYLLLIVFFTDSTAGTKRGWNGNFYQNKGFCNLEDREVFTNEPVVNSICSTIDSGPMMKNVDLNDIPGNDGDSVVNSIPLVSIGYSSSIIGDEEFASKCINQVKEFLQTKPLLELCDQFFKLNYSSINKQKLSNNLNEFFSLESVKDVFKAGNAIKLLRVFFDSDGDVHSHIKNYYEELLELSNNSIFKVKCSICADKVCLLSGNKRERKRIALIIAIISEGIAFAELFAFKPIYKMLSHNYAASFLHESAKIVIEEFRILLEDKEFKQLIKEFDPKILESTGGIIYSTNFDTTPTLIMDEEDEFNADSFIKANRIPGPPGHNYSKRVDKYIAWLKATISDPLFLDFIAKTTYFKYPPEDVRKAVKKFFIKNENEMEQLLSDQRVEPLFDCFVGNNDSLKPEYELITILYNLANKFDHVKQEAKIKTPFKYFESFLKFILPLPPFSGSLKFDAAWNVLKNENFRGLFSFDFLSTDLNFEEKSQFVILSLKSLVEDDFIYRLFSQIVEPILKSFFLNPQSIENTLSTVITKCFTAPSTQNIEIPLIILEEKTPSNLSQVYFRFEDGTSYRMGSRLSKIVSNAKLYSPNIVPVNLDSVFLVLGSLLYAEIGEVFYQFSFSDKLKEFAEQLNHKTPNNPCLEKALLHPALSRNNSTTIIEMFSNPNLFYEIILETSQTGKIILSNEMKIIIDVFFLNFVVDNGFVLYTSLGDQLAMHILKLQVQSMNLCLVPDKYGILSYYLNQLFQDPLIVGKSLSNIPDLSLFALASDYDFIMTTIGAVFDGPHRGYADMLANSNLLKVFFLDSGSDSQSSISKQLVELLNNRIVMRKNYLGILPLESKCKEYIKKDLKFSIRSFTHLKFGDANTIFGIEEENALKLVENNDENFLIYVPIWYKIQMAIPKIPDYRLISFTIQNELITTSLNENGEFNEFFELKLEPQSVFLFKEAYGDVEEQVVYLLLSRAAEMIRDKENSQMIDYFLLSNSIGCLQS